MLTVGYLLSVGYPFEQEVTELGYLDTSVSEDWSLRGKLVYLCMH